VTDHHDIDVGETMSDTNDVEKRWNDPAAFRAAAIYVAAVVLVAGLALAVYALLARDMPLWSVGTPLVLLIGGLGAFVKTYRAWRARQTWPFWQGAGWFLLTLMLVSLSIPGMALTE
jgi:hypothetical protein